MNTDQAAMEQAYERVGETTAWLLERTKHRPQFGLILGSGLGVMADELTDRESFAYEDIPNFPHSTVVGHAGELVFGELEGKTVVAMKGRFHYYEGWSLEQVTFPVRMFARMGCTTMLVTNSAGGVNPDLAPGSLMLIRDHLNLTGVNPLRGLNDERLGVRFPDMTNAYNRDLRRTIMRAAEQQGTRLHTGVYAGVLGPSYETPAEVRMLRRLGGDAVGMSTVPEVIVGNHIGLRVAGISCITNYAAGITEEPLTHDEVTETAALVRSQFSGLLRRSIAMME